MWLIVFPSIEIASLFYKHRELKAHRTFILKCENDFISNHASDPFGNLTDTSGSCALIAMITQDRKIIFVNIGDSRALLLSSEYKVFFATEDHKPNSPSEQMRIIKAGGCIYQNQMNSQERTISSFSRATERVADNWRCGDQRRKIRRKKRNNNTNS